MLDIGLLDRVGTMGYAANICSWLLTQNDKLVKYLMQEMLYGT